MTSRLRDQIEGDDPVVAAAARYLSAAPAIPDLDGMQARVARALAARPIGRARSGAAAKLAIKAALVVALAAGVGWLVYPRAERKSIGNPPAHGEHETTRRGPGTLPAPPPRFHGAGGAAVPEAPPIPETLLWAAGHETSDLGEWKGRGSFLGLTYAMPGTERAVTAAVAHTGQRALRFVVDADGSDRSTRGELSGPMPEEAYYSAWLYLPERHHVHDFWGLLVFKSRSDPADRNSRFSVVAVNLRDRADGEMVLYIWDYVRRRNIEAAAPRAVPIGAWFHVEVRLARAPGGRAAIEVWQDGVSVLSASDLSISEPYVLFSVGITAGKFSPQRAVLYVDDLAVSRVRLGPSAPAFLFEPPRAE